ncbi:MAG TPA: NUDIX hydrolase [Candidatus Dormibacteraeota bacterium]
MPEKGGLITRFLIANFGGVYNDLIGRRSHLGVAAVIFDAEGRVLLVHQSYGRRGWDLPGGGREARESLEQALRRELREEIGVELVSADLCGVYYEPGVDQHHFAFRCLPMSGVSPVPHSPEIIECHYFPIDDLPCPINDFTIRQITDAKSGSTQVPFATLGPRSWIEER